MKVQPYLMFNGCCAEAIDYYRKALDASVEMMMRVKDAPEPVPGMAPDKVMHACVRFGDTALMASDCGPDQPAGFDGFSLAYTAADDADARRRFEALADGGKVVMPLAKTFFASSFGVVADRFGVSWMVVTESGQA
jgi:PhnB protein